MSSQMGRNTIREDQGWAADASQGGGCLLVSICPNLVIQEEADFRLKTRMQYTGCQTCTDDTALVHTNSVIVQSALNACAPKLIS